MDIGQYVRTHNLRSGYGKGTRMVHLWLDDSDLTLCGRHFRHTYNGPWIWDGDPVCPDCQAVIETRAGEAPAVTPRLPNRPSKRL